MRGRKLPIEGRLDDPLRSVLPDIQRRIIRGTTWFGVQAWQNPLDAWIYQELITRQRPDWIVEVGVNAGGSTLMLAHLCDLLGTGQVIGLELEPDRIDPRVREHPRVTILEGPALESVDAVYDLTSGSDSTLVIEDSSHTFEHTLAVCRAFGPLVQPDGYLIVEDGICWHGLDIGPSPGPYEAAHAFVEEDDRFEMDRSLEDFCITWNPGGYLRRVG